MVTNTYPATTSILARDTVEYHHPDLSAILVDYETIRDCLAGQTAIKARGEKYLPKPNPTDKSDENTCRYRDYLQRAIFYNYTYFTQQNLVGQVFSRDPLVEIPDEFDFMLEDCDGRGLTMDQVARKVTEWVVAFGRAGLLADFPPVADDASVEDAEGVRPVIRPFAPWDIINWRVRQIGAIRKLSLVVMREWVELDDYVGVEDDTNHAAPRHHGFAFRRQLQYRALRLNSEGHAQVAIWRYFSRQGNKGNEQGFINEGYYDLTDASGAPLTFLPFEWVGAQNNDFEVDRPPLFDIAALNIGHYINSAEHEETTYMAGQPTPVAEGVPDDWFDGKPFQLGTRTAQGVPPGASVNLLQMAQDTVSSVAMEKKQDQIRALGGKLLERPVSNVSATEAILKRRGETSVLESIAKNVSSAMEKSIINASYFVGDPFTEDNVTYQLNSNFDLAIVSNDTLLTMQNLHASGLAADEEVRRIMTLADLTTMDEEEFEAWKRQEELQNMLRQAQAGFPSPVGPNEFDEDAEDDDGEEFPGDEDPFGRNGQQQQTLSA